MTRQQILSHQLENGLTLVGEVMPWLESAALSFSVPAGCQFDPVDRLGLANFTCDMVQRGCAELDNRAFLEKLESLGVDFGSSVSVYHTHFSGAMPAGQLQPALECYADMLRRPWLPESQIEDSRQVCLQEVRSIDDDLAQRVIYQLRLRQYGHPRGRWSQGTIDAVNRISVEDVRRFFEEYYQPQKVILSVAGNIDWPVLVQAVEEMLGDWTGTPTADPADTGVETGSLHIPFESQQSHIAIACPTVPYRHDQYFLARGAVGVLSDGMSSRLFTEIRERRGLCYTVYASLHSLADRACIVSYVGTGADKAQQSLDALVQQLQALSHGIQEAELARLKVQIRSSLVMQQESSRARAGAIAGDWFHLGRARTLDEVTSLINSLTVEQINTYLRENPLGDFNLVTLGPEPLEINCGVPAAPAG